MEIILVDSAEEDLVYWKNSGNTKIQNKIKELLRNICQTPFEVIGKPEALKHNLSGYWSRRINREHRIVYQVDNEKEIIYVHSLKGHY